MEKYKGHLFPEFYLTCPMCNHREEYEYDFGLFDEIFYSDGRFPNESLWECPKCHYINPINSVKESVNSISISSMTIPFEYIVDGEIKKTTLIADDFTIYAEIDSEWLDLNELYSTAL